MITFTLDTNCLIDVEDYRPARDYVLRLINAADSGIASVAIVASSASERQPGGIYLDSFSAFQDRMNELGFGSVSLLMPIARWNLSFYGFGVWADDRQTRREQLIFETLFPSFPFHWQDYALANGLDIDCLNDPLAFKWRNRLCDAQGFWAHDKNRRDVFVTSDRNFEKRLSTVSDFANSVISTPEQAAARLD